MGTSQGFVKARLRHITTGDRPGLQNGGTNYQRTHKLDVVNVIWWDITCHEWTMVLLESIKHNSEFRFSDSSIPSSWYAKWAAMDKGDYGKELWAHEKLRHIPILVGWTPISSGLRILDGEIAMFVGSNMKNLAGHKKFLDWVRPSTSPGPGECPWLQEVGLERKCGYSFWLNDSGKRRSPFNWWCILEESFQKWIISSLWSTILSHILPT